MNLISLIERKRDGLELSDEEWSTVVRSYLDGRFADYQMAALLMAVCIRGMSPRESVTLTRAMAESGARLDLSSIPGKKVDKHSTGGVGDKVTLVAVPIAAAAGVPVAKLSGRGLGHTGGTLDKLEAIPGFNVELTQEEFVAQVSEIGLAVAGASPDLAPADKAIYALRDVTGTVASVPLIVASILSKKWAGGCDAVVVDVKWGRGAFARTKGEGETLARALTEVGRDIGLEVRAVLSAMNQPLGRAVGNALEVREAISTLKGEGPGDVRELSLEIAAGMIALCKGLGSREAFSVAQDVLRSGEALERFAAMAEAQGSRVDVRFEENIPVAACTKDVCLESGGSVACLDALKVGLAAAALGAGRRRKGDTVDYGAGLLLHRKEGDDVAPGEPVATLYGSGEAGIAEAETLVRKAYRMERK